MIIPWRVDVPQDRRPFINWLIIAGAIAAFVLSIISVEERRAKLPEKIKEYKNRSVEDMAKEFGVGEQQLKEIEQSVEKIQKAFPKGKTSPNFKEELIKQTILNEYFV